MGVRLNQNNLDQLAKQRKRQKAIYRKMKRKERLGKFLKILAFVVIFIIVFDTYDKGMEEKFHLNFDFKMPKINFKMPKFEFKMPDFSSNKKDKKKDSSGNYTSELTGKVVSYVPVDDRPIYTTRIQYLADSFGIKLKMPDNKYYKTYVGEGENSYPNYSTKYGNPDKIAKWLEDQEDAGCDYYIISLDQMFSGGIVGSSYLTDDDMKIYGNGVKASKKVITKLLEDENNHIYFIDSVMGLSVESGFMDFTEEDKQMLLGYTSQSRKELKGDDLTISKIADHYGVDSSGNSIPTDNMNLDKLSRYLSARERKLKYSEYIINTIHSSGNKNAHIYYGISDSGASSYNIQRNDVDYILYFANKNHVDVPILDGVSTMTQYAFSDMLLDSVSKKLKVKVTYYGDYNQAIDSSDYTYGGYLAALLDNLSIRQVEENPDFEILVYTNNQYEVREEKARSLTIHYLENIREHIPTVIMNDASIMEDQILINYLSDYDTNQVPMGYLIGYSNWNRFVDSSKIALAEGITRSLYLLGEGDSADCDKGYVKVMAESFIEDMAYLPFNKDTLDVDVTATNMTENAKKIIANLQAGNYISSIKPYSESGIRSVGAYNYNYPWNRVEELDFDVSATLTDAKKITIPDHLPEKEG